MNKLPLSTKLIVAFLVSALISLGIGVVGLIGVIQLRSNVTEVGAVRFPSIVGLSTIGDALTEIDGMENTLMSPDYPADQRKELYKDIATAWERVDKGRKIYDPLPQTAEEAVLWKSFLSAFDEWKKHHQTYMQLAREFGAAQEQKADAATLRAINEKMTEQMFGHNDAAVEKTLDSLAKVFDLNVGIGNDFTQRSFSQSKIILTALIGSVVLGFVFAVGIGIFVARAISVPVREIARQLDAGAAETTEAAGQVSAASQSLAEDSSQQAASLEETSASIEEMSSMTKRNAEHARNAKTLAQAAHQAAEKATSDIATMTDAMKAVGQSSDQLRAAMDKIESSSNEITQIMKTIDEIAFQTNILSLNAAVEAARAGEAGAGFAVVADEVRSLAQRSAEAARQTARMIKDSTDSSHQGMVVTEKVAADLANMAKTAKQVGNGLEAILTKSKQVDDVIAEIATASSEQELGIGQVNNSITQMDKTTQSNAANAEETASAAEELNAQALELKGAVIRLQQLVDGNRSSAPLVTPPTPTYQPRTSGKSPVGKNGKNGVARAASPAPAETSLKRPSSANAIPMDDAFKDMD